MGEKRLRYLDMVKGIGIILVVAGHSTYMNEGLLSWISTFHMPLFFVVSGMLIQYSSEESRSMKELLRRKLQGIMIPYLGFSITYLLIGILTGYHDAGKDMVSVLIRELVEFATLYGISVLWFLPALFLGEMLFLGVRRCNKHWITIAAAILLAVVAYYGQKGLYASNLLGREITERCIGYVWMAVMRGCVAYIFLTAGYYFQWCLQKMEAKHSTEEKVSRRLRTGIRWGLVILLLGISIGITVWNGRVDLHYLVMNQPLLYFVGAISGSVFLIELCRSIPAIKALEYCGRNSLIIMATHLQYRVVYLAITFSLLLNRLVSRGKLYVHLLCMAALIVVMELLLIFMINRYIPLLAGGRRAVKRTDRSQSERKNIFHSP